MLRRSQWSKSSAYLPVDEFRIIRHKRKKRWYLESLTVKKPDFFEICIRSDASELSDLPHLIAVDHGCNPTVAIRNLQVGFWRLHSTLRLSRRSHTGTDWCGLVLVQFSAGWFWISSRSVCWQGAVPLQLLRHFSYAGTAMSARPKSICLLESTGCLVCFGCEGGSCCLVIESALISLAPCNTAPFVATVPRHCILNIEIIFMSLSLSLSLYTHYQLKLNFVAVTNEMDSSWAT